MIRKRWRDGEAVLSVDTEDEFGRRRRQVNRWNSRMNSLRRSV